MRKGAWLRRKAAGAALLVLLLCALTGMPRRATAAGSSCGPSARYELIPSGGKGISAAYTLVISGSGEVVATNYPVSKNSITEVIVGEGVTKIGENAFAAFGKAERVALPESLREIGDGAFAQCDALSVVALPRGLTSVGDRAFYRCRGLSYVGLSAGVKEIGVGAFQECVGLTGVSIEEGAPVAIGRWAFQGCVSLSRAVIPESTVSIYDNAFSGCGNQLVIYGRRYTLAERYANRMGIQFAVNTAPASALPGDADGDGNVDSYDAALLLQYEVALIDRDALPLAALDLDGDGNVDSYDAALILQYDVGLIGQFPGK